jgi:hypothetical protein
VKRQHFVAIVVAIERGMHAQARELEFLARNLAQPVLMTDAAAAFSLLEATKYPSLRWSRATTRA